MCIVNALERIRYLAHKSRVCVSINFFSSLFSPDVLRDFAKVNPFRLHVRITVVKISMPFPLSCLTVNSIVRHSRINTLNTGKLSVYDTVH